VRRSATPSGALDRVRDKNYSYCTSRAPTPSRSNPHLPRLLEPPRYSYCVGIAGNRSRSAEWDGEPVSRCHSSAAFSTNVVVIVLLP
jgi:hypothetical protein